MENLRAFEREYRSRLKTYFSQQLQALDGNGEAAELPGPGGESGPHLTSVPEDQEHEHHDSE